MRYLLITVALLSSSLFASDKPNIIFILTDDQGWNSLSIQSDPKIPGSGSTYYQTPNLSKLAQSGIRSHKYMISEGGIRVPFIIALFLCDEFGADKPLKRLV